MFNWFKRALSQSSATPQDAKIYDFLYCDTRRVASFLAQFNPSGYLTATRDTKLGKSTLGSTASLAGGLLGAGLSGAWSREDGRQTEETYDPFWTGAISLLGHLEARQLLKTDMHEAGIGQLVLVAGNFRLLDLRNLKEVLGVPKLAAKFGIGDTKRMSPEKLEENLLALEFVKVMPYTVQAQIFCPEGPDKKFSAAWMTLNPDSMVIPPGDILMKYGHWVSGTWKMLGIKDAAVDGGPQIDPELAELTKTMDFGEIAIKRHSTSLAILAEFFAPLARKAMGRPGIFYGVTPILIFREVSA